MHSRRRWVRLPEKRGLTLLPCGDDSCLVLDCVLELCEGCVWRELDRALARGGPTRPGVCVSPDTAEELQRESAGKGTDLMRRLSIVTRVVYCDGNSG